LAGLKFSTSPSEFGKFLVSIIMKIVVVSSGTRSLIVNIGLNLILSMFVCELLGFEEPVWCSSIM